MDAGARLLIRALERGSTVRLQAQGDCMEPILRDHDWAWIEPLAGSVRCGDVVLARTDRGEFVCHRVLGLRRGYILAAGDRGSEIQRHSRDEVFGRLVAIERDGEKRAFRRRPVDGPQARMRLVARFLRRLAPGRVARGLRRRLFDHSARHRDG